jgi:hypothetical protein
MKKKIVDQSLKDFCFPIFCLSLTIENFLKQFSFVGFNSLNFLTGGIFWLFCLKIALKSNSSHS